MTQSKISIVVAKNSRASSQPWLVWRKNLNTKLERQNYAEINIDVDASNYVGVEVATKDDNFISSNDNKNSAFVDAKELNL